MAWWTHLLFFKSNLGEKREELPKEEFTLAYLQRALKRYLYEHIIDLLYFFLSIVTYSYLALSAVTFFFEKQVPKFFPNIIEIFSEPYLGVLGIYVVVKEIERRRGKVEPRTWSELFAILWFGFFIVATVLTYYSDNFEVSEVYKTVVTNSLAAIIIRLGTILR